MSMLLPCAKCNGPMRKRWALSFIVKSQQSIKQKRENFVPAVGEENFKPSSLKMQPSYPS